MKSPSLFLLSCIMATAVGGDARAAEEAVSPLNGTIEPPLESGFTADVSTCILCHTTPELFQDEKQKYFISKDQLARDGHLKKGVRCHTCHGGNPTAFDAEGAHATEVMENDLGITPFRLPLAKVQQACFDCHQDQSGGLIHGVHAEAGKDEDGNKRPLLCSECHGEKTHGIPAVDDPNSPVFAEKQVQLCGGCHEKAWKEYNESVHGHGLHEAGLLVAAVCADCHGAHAIYPAKDERSTLHVTNVAGTCSMCHRFIEERLRHSVHGGGNGLGGRAEKPAPGGAVDRHPSCTDCHAGHDLPHPNSPAFRLQSADRCGDCHVNLFRSYGISMHGELTNLGHVPGAKCSDCHGAHDILPLGDPNCRLTLGANRLATCRECHPEAVENFLDFDPHADHHNPDRSLVLHAVYVVLMTLLIGTFSFFGLHSFFWFFRNLIEVLQHGRPKSLTPGETAYTRFSPFHRVGHTVMVVSFLGLASTGLPLKYSQHEWAQTLAYYLGGFESTGLWHRIFGLINIGCLVVYVGLMLTRLLANRGNGGSLLNRIFGPDSPVPNVRDVTDFAKMIRWFVGRGPKPTFERWAYWEKVDMWGASADIVIIGFTGLVLWLPNLFCSFLPGATLNIAKVIHSTQALLATGFVFSIHFFSTHLRPDKFPLDMSILTGLVSEQDMEEERPEYFARLRREGKLDAMKATVPSRGKLIMVAMAGLLAFSIGLALLAGILIAILGE